MFFNEEGILNIDEMVVNNASFKNIMEDGVITEAGGSSLICDDYREIIHPKLNDLYYYGNTQLYQGPFQSYCGPALGLAIQSNSTKTPAKGGP